ncbi:hypothetical protein HF292_007425 [Acidithiobacillus ferruginosus]|uniref:Uncharacterized protein n=1 Tax=Acidithiobacillus ferruginosus TaxID=3063951 RepID=A0ACD5IL46_9PROT|nr:MULTISPECIES: hypothetical protein [Acidithiobacillus]MBU2814242.1 hypothetical protein [Acidithiobacillus ferruginosus]MBU2837196.1 hypothetical protein [Acidithiobacillus thiooxidans]
MTKPKTQPKNPRALDINCKPEDMADGTARALLDPAATAALAMEMIYSKGGGLPVDVNSLRKATATNAAQVADGDMAGVKKMLASQLHTLDALFSRMVRHAEGSTTLEQYKAHAGLALRAAQQTAATARVLGELVNPNTPTFIKQQSVDARTQTLIQGQAAPAQESHNPHNELLGVTHEQIERMDTGAPRKASGTDPAMATLGEVHRPQDRAGEDHRRRQSEG